MSRESTKFFKKFLEEEWVSGHGCGQTRCGMCSGYRRQSGAAFAARSCMARSGSFARSAGRSLSTERRGLGMTLQELSIQYRAGAETLRQRVRLLESRRTAAVDEHGRRLLEQRIRHLEAMWREARDLAVLCERYYDRGYHCNVRYTI